MMILRVPMVKVLLVQIRIPNHHGAGCVTEDIQWQRFHLVRHKSTISCFLRISEKSVFLRVFLKFCPCVLGSFLENVESSNIRIGFRNRIP